MSYESTKNIFKLMKLLSGEIGYSIVEIEDLLGINERTFYRYQKVMFEFDFVLNCIDGKYIQDKKISTFTFNEIINRSNSVSFSIEKFNLRKSKNVDFLKVYNLLFDKEDKQLPVDFMYTFISDFQEFYLN